MSVGAVTRNSKKCDKPAETFKKKVVKCRWCGQKHEIGRKNCPASGGTCSKCSKKGHVAIVCRSRAVQSVEINPNPDDPMIQSLQISSCDVKEGPGRMFCGALNHLPDDGVIRYLCRRTRGF